MPRRIRTAAITGREVGVQIVASSVRGAAALCLAVLAADLSSVQHGFWVVFGALTVLCSNVLNTGRNPLGVLMGNVVGFLISAGLILAVGAPDTVLLLLLPPAVALAALAPGVVPVTLGQAGFTTALLILYDLVDPGGWEVGWSAWRTWRSAVR